MRAWLNFATRLSSAGNFRPELCPIKRPRQKPGAMCSTGWRGSACRPPPGSADTRAGTGAATSSRSMHHAPFTRDGVFDHDGVSAPCIAAPYILPSAPGDVLGLRDFRTFAARYPIPHNCCLRFVAAVASVPRNTRYRPGAAPYPDRTRRLDQISLSWRTPILDTSPATSCNSDYDGFCRTKIFSFSIGNAVMIVNGTIDRVASSILPKPSMVQAWTWMSSSL
jgi:hypothetical protein